MSRRMALGGWADAEPLTVVVSGYYGFGNAGDEGLLEALLSTWRRRGVPVRFVVLSAAPEETARRYGVDAVARTDLFAIRNALRQADLFLSGGGSLLQDATSARTIPYYAGLIGLARRWGVPVVIYGQGIGPIERPGLRRIAGRALQAAALVAVRDEASRREALQLGVAPDRLAVTADPVFAFGGEEGGTGLAPGVHPLPEPLHNALAGGPLLGVSLRPLQGDGAGERTGQLIGRLADGLAPWLDRRGVRIFPLPLYFRQDESVLTRLTKKLGPERVVPWPAEVAPDELALADWLAVFHRLELSLVMRLHGLIFSAVAGTPAVALADDPKVEAHGDELGLDRAAMVWSAADVAAGVYTPGELTGMVEAAWRARTSFREGLGRAVSALGRRAQAAPDLVVAATGALSPDGRRRVSVLDVAFDPVTLEDTVAAVAGWIDAGGGPIPGSVPQARRPAHIVTANPEIVMHARRDPVFRAMLAAADRVVADGIGIVAGARLLGTPVPERVAGVELMEALLGAGDRAGWKVFLLGGQPGVADGAAATIHKKWPGVRIVGVRHGYFPPHEEGDVARAVAATKPDLVFVGMGAPRQERFIAARRRPGTEGDWQGIGAAVGVGGALDVLAGRVRRASVRWQRLGLEWLYRLVRQPSRLRRALALPRFALLVLLRALRRNLL